MGDLATIDGGRGASGNVGLPAVTAPPSPGEWQAMKQQAEVIARSGLAPKAVSSPDKILVIAMKARELNLPPMQGLSHIHIVEGRPALSAELMVALVQRAGHKLRVLETSSKKCVVEGVRADDPRHPSRVEWTIEDAKTAGVAHKGPWKSYPAAMLRARAISALCRFAFADILMGASYVPEELGAEVNEDGEVLSVPVEEAEVVEEEPASEKQSGYLKGLMRDLGVNRIKIEERHGPVEEWRASKVSKWIDDFEQRKRAKAETPTAEVPNADDEEEAVPNFDDMRGAARDADEDRNSDPYEELRDLLDMAYADRSDREFGHEWYERARLAGAPIGTLSTTEVLDLIRELEDGGDDA